MLRLILLIFLANYSCANIIEQNIRKQIITIAPSQHKTQLNSKLQKDEVDVNIDTTTNKIREFTRKNNDNEIAIQANSEQFATSELSQEQFINLYFEDNSFSLNSLNQQIIKDFIKILDNRINLIAYANLQNTTDPMADKRMALQRMVAIRKFLLEELGYKSLLISLKTNEINNINDKNKIQIFIEKD
jgi:uncharacterized protein YacL (UPF0231 family)